MLFRDRVLNIVSRIPKGRTMTYAEVAAKAGNKKAARAVGSIISTNYDPAIPCHRVIRSDGGMGGYNKGVRRKKEMLRREGVVIETG